MRFVFLIMAVTLFCFDAHAQEAGNAAVPDSGSAYQLQSKRSAGSVSRFQRQVIVADKAAKNPNASPASQYFDDVMDHLEFLMKDEIAKNNKIAALQEKIPGYKF